MSITIPRAEIRAVLLKHGASQPISGDVPANYVRTLADGYRADSKVDGGPLATALDALVDRIKNERDAHCIAYSHDPDTGKCVCGHPDEMHDRDLGQCEAPLNAEEAA